MKTIGLTTKKPTQAPTNPCQMGVEHNPIVLSLHLATSPLLVFLFRCMDARRSGCGDIWDCLSAGCRSLRHRIRSARNHARGSNSSGPLTKGLRSIIEPAQVATFVGWRDDEVDH